ncbi:winged helix-turn-helix transcriptional regulator [Marinospirillum perlucidum]|uniref:winged helix-turn-helix transcriptional regulator n=1 Tax=Marinospirillum perlucidum TaxID=1982602 RepID=UPI000DF1827F|nr:helix-turn-helix domain-containing protein [Marinospirillum perlucidum]
MKKNISTQTAVLDDQDAASFTERFRRGDLFSDQCPSRDVLKHITSRWGVLILVALQGQTLRFSDLRRKIKGVSEKMLAQTLQALESDGFVKRISYPVVPPHVDYSLSALGEEAAQQVAGIANWIEDKMPEITQARQAVAAEREQEAAARAEN